MPVYLPLHAGLSVLLRRMRLKADLNLPDHGMGRAFRTIIRAPTSINLIYLKSVNHFGLNGVNNYPCLTVVFVTAA